MAFLPSPGSGSVGKGRLVWARRRGTQCRVVPIGHPSACFIKIARVIAVLFRTLARPPKKACVHHRLGRQTDDLSADPTAPVAAHECDQREGQRIPRQDKLPRPATLAGNPDKTQWEKSAAPSVTRRKPIRKQVKTAFSPRASVQFAVQNAARNTAQQNFVISTA